MTVVIAQSIQKKEFRRGEIPPDDLETILGGYAKGILRKVLADRALDDPRMHNVPEYMGISEQA